jgi:hypothetical protein
MKIGRLFGTGIVAVSLLLIPISAQAVNSTGLVTVDSTCDFYGYNVVSQGFFYEGCTYEGQDCNIVQVTLNDGGATGPGSAYQGSYAPSASGSLHYKYSYSGAIHGVYLPF